MAQLSKRDKAILNCIFNPNLPLEESLANEDDKCEDVEDLTPEIQKSKTIELEAIQTTENGDLEKGLQLINQAINVAPNRPSLYNNRANIYQYLRRFDDAFTDLNTAIELCSDKDNYKKTLSQAYCQRGLLYRRSDRPQEAVCEFEKAAKLGSQFAKSQLVELNPYAALCNQMLRQVMEKLN